MSFQSVRSPTALSYETGVPAMSSVADPATERRRKSLYPCFLRFVTAAYKLKAAQRTWQGIIQILTHSLEPETELRAKALAAYRPDPSKVFLPNYVPINNPPRPAPVKAGIANPPFSKNKPLTRRYYLEDLARD